MLKCLAGIFLLIGSVIGGGILAIPIVSAKFGFLVTLILIVIAWGIMTKTGLYILDLSLSCPEKYNSYYSIVGKFLGSTAQRITILLFLWLLYFSLASYISGCASVILTHLKTVNPFISYFNTSLLFVFVAGSFLVIGAKFIFRINAFIVAMKLLLLLLVIVSSAFLIKKGVPLTLMPFKHTGLLSLFLIIINAFGFQFIVPSIVSYYGRDNRLIFNKMLIFSTSTVLILYIAWLYTVYTLIPMEGDKGLIAIYQSNNQLFAFNESLAYFVGSSLVMRLLSFFQVVALFGSFFCISLGVFDFLVDVFKAQNRVIIGIITFLPPLLLSLLSQNMYTYAMSGAGYIAVILEIIIPVWAQKIHKARPL
ncbi:MAG: hypothetical protein H2069_02820 [Legionella sp.]|nr:hypothetical protein [Legionella sp.]